MCVLWSTAQEIGYLQEVMALWFERSRSVVVARERGNVSDPTFPLHMFFDPTARLNGWDCVRL